MLAVGHPSSMLTKTSKARFGVILTNNLSRDPYGIFFLAYDSRMHCVSLIRNFKLKMYIFESRITVCLCYRKNHNNVLFFSVMGTRH